MRQDLLKMLGLTMAVGTVVACGPSEDPQSEPQPVDSTSVRQAVSESVGSSIDAVADGLAFLGESDLFNDYVWSSVGDDDYYCDDTPVVPMPGEDPIEPIPCEQPEAEPFAPDFDEERDEIRRVLEELILADANIESSSDTEVTYLLRGEVVCAEEEEDDRAECEEDVDALEVRLIASSMAAGEVDIRVNLGPDRIAPLSMGFGPERVSGDLDLEALREAIDFASAQLGESLPEELPSTMEGRLSAQLSQLGDAVELKVGIAQAIAVAGEGYSINIAASPQAFEVKADPQARKLSVEVGLNAADISFPTGEVEECFGSGIPDEFGDNEFTCEVVDEGYQMGAALAGLQGALSFLAGEERLELRGFGLGDAPAKAFVEGEEVAALDFNAANGRSLDLDLAKDGDDVAISMSPGLDLELMLALYRAQDVIQDLEEWMLDDVLSLVIDGDASPALRFGDEGLKLERGAMMMRSESADITLDVEAGMCIGDIEPAEGSPEHPLATLGVVACGE